MDYSFYDVNDKLIIDDKVREWCILSYPDHPKGCPNYGKKKVCPPFAPYVRDYFNFDNYLVFVVVKFDIGFHISKMRVKHPNWTERQCRNLLYWQSTVMKELRRVVEEEYPNCKVTYIPEAMGVNVFETCRNLGIPIERNPVYYVHKIALVERVKRQPVVVGSGYVPYINKDEHEPETMAEMIGSLGGW